MEPTEELFAFIRTDSLTAPVDLRLRTDFLKALETLVDRGGIPYQRLIQTSLPTPDS